MKATPRPWKAEYGYVGATRRLFVTIPTEDGFLPWTDDDARLIVTAVNNFDAMVETLEKLAKLGAGDQYGNSDGNRIAQATLAKIKAELD